MPIKPAFLLILCSTMVLLSHVNAGQYAEINDPTGLVRIYAGKNLKAPVVKTVKTGERISFEWDDNPDWIKIALKSGKFGWIPSRAVRLHFTEKDLPIDEKDPAGLSEIEELAERRGFSYARDTQLAARGDFGLLKKFFEIMRDADGAAAESIGDLPTVVYHLLGDEKFAEFLNTQPLSYRMMVRSEILSHGLPVPTGLYLRLHFPRTAAVLFRREMVDWPSPDGLYAIRKVFNKDLELAGSKVVEAELIEKKSGRVLCDLKPDDIGTGVEREGEVWWSPDSKRVACLSSDLTPQQGNLFEEPTPPPQRMQTAIYQLTGSTFSRVELSLNVAPDPVKDPELKRAIPVHIYTEPVSWLKPEVLVLRRHEYYRQIRPTKVDGITFDSIHDLARQYEITVTFQPDGQVKAGWKRQRN